MHRPLTRITEFNIDSYNADPEGVQDSTEAVRQAVNDAYNVANKVLGGTVIVPPGTYRLTDTITLPGPVQIRGAGPVASKFTLDVENDVPAFSLTGIQGAVLRDFGVVASNAGTGTGLCLYGLSQADAYGAKGLRTNLNNLCLEKLDTGLRLGNCDNVDISSINILWFKKYGIQIRGAGADLFLSKIHIWNVGNPNKASENYSLHLQDVGGLMCSDSDFIGSYVGVRIVANGNSFYNTFSQVQCDTVDLDPWHIGQEGETGQVLGLQMVNCWSSTFYGTGTYSGPNVFDASVVNHQWRNGLSQKDPVSTAIGFDVPSGGRRAVGVVFTGGIMDTQLPKQVNVPLGVQFPSIVNVINYIQPTQQTPPPDGNAVCSSSGRPVNIYIY